MKYLICLLFLASCADTPKAIDKETANSVIEKEEKNTKPRIVEIM